MLPSVLMYEPELERGGGARREGGGARRHAQQFYWTPLPSHSEGEGQAGVVKLTMYIYMYTTSHMLHMYEYNWRPRKVSDIQ